MLMLGVVVWSKESAQAAVIWCEDHGEIAYLKGYQGLSEPPDYTSPDAGPPLWPAVGDLVTLDISAAGGMRLARNLAILEADWAPALAGSLTETARGLGVTAVAARPEPPAAWRPPVLPFPPAPFAPVPAEQGMMPPAAGVRAGAGPGTTAELAILPPAMARPARGRCA